MNHHDLLELDRSDFPALTGKRNGKLPVYLDNACTTLVPKQVIAAMNEYYEQYPACGGRRSHHWFAEEVTTRVDGSIEKGRKGTRQLVADFIHAGSKYEIIFTANTTYSINMIALGLKFKSGDVVLLSDREHNSNLLPWLRLQKAGAIQVDHFTIDDGPNFDLEAFEEHFKGQKVRLVSLAWTSNVTGVTLPANEIIAIAHRHGARVLLDGAQTVPHQPVDVRALDVDFLAFSLHKMCGPRGVGILYVKKELMGSGAGEWDAGEDVIEPTILGGGTVDDSSQDSYCLLDGPERFEAGIPNYSGQIGAGAAVEYLTRVGLDRIRTHEEHLNIQLTRALVERYGNGDWFNIIGPEDARLRGGILTFEVRRPNAVGIATELDARSNIMIRDGVFCVHSFFNDRFGQGWIHPRSHRDHRMIYRVSLYLYNTYKDCEVFLETLDKVFRERSYVFDE